MADPARYRPAPGTIPVDPGVYKFRDESGRVLYVGKAKNLRARLANYFQDLTQLHPRTRQMVLAAAGVEWTVVANEVEALQLEYTWIKRFDPRYNVKFRDDKTYPMLAVSVREEIPRVFFYRGPRRKGIRYFGPYSQVWAVRETLDLLLRLFPMRTCAKGVYNRYQALGRPCLLGYIGKCDAPCVGRVTAEEHRETVRALVAFMSGRTNEVVREITARMEMAAENLEFEQAARWRDNLVAIEKIMEKQAVVLGDGTDADLIAFATDELEASVQIFHVRGGRIRGQRGWVVEKGEGLVDSALPALMQDFLVHFYSDAVECRDAEATEEAREVQPVPKEVLVQVLPEEAAEVQAILTRLRGSHVNLRVPQRGDKRSLMETVQKNAQEQLRQHKLQRVGDLTARSAALQDIQELLGMEQAPLRIECTDISHLQGTDVVASVVVFDDGLPRKSDYRRYRIQEAAGEGHSNDVACIAEITRRRFSGQAGENPSQHPPQLFIVDGGAPQVAAAQKVFDELGIVDVTLVGLAKRLEEIWVPGEEEPLILPRKSPALFLLQRIRDEAHRFAISYHRQQRSQRMRRSILDDIAGLGAQRRADLLKHFGSVKNLRAASVAEIMEVRGFGQVLATTVYEYLQANPA